MDESRQAKVFDSEQQLVGEAYAHALIGLGQKKGATDKLVEQLEGVADAIRQLPKLDAMLQSPRIAIADKRKILNKALAGRVDDSMLNFLGVVLKKGRFHCLDAIQNAARKIYDELSGRVRATMTTAENVDDSVRQRVEEKLTNRLGKQIQLVARIDPAIVGGMVIRIGDTVYDGSVQSQLRRVRGRASKRAEEAIRASLEKFLAS